MQVRILMLLTSFFALTGCNDSIVRNNLTIQAAEVVIETTANVLQHPAKLIKR